MSNKFFGRGNLGAEPVLRYTAGEDGAPVCDLRVYFDRRKPDGNGGYVESGGFWMDVSLWGARGELAARLLKKGARVSVIGDQFEDTWDDRDTGERRSKYRVRADTVDLDLSRVDSIVWKTRAEHAEVNERVAKQA